MVRLLVVDVCGCLDQIPAINCLRRGVDFGWFCAECGHDCWIRAIDAPGLREALELVWQRVEGDVTEDEFAPLTALADALGETDD